MHMNAALQTHIMIRVEITSAIHQCLSTYTDASELFIYRPAEHRNLHVKYLMVDVDKIGCS